MKRVHEFTLESPQLGQHGLQGATLTRSVDALADTLRVNTRAPVAALLHNGVLATLLELAARAAGRSWMPLPTFFSDAQLRGLLERCPPGELITDDPTRLAELLDGPHTRHLGPGDTTRFVRRGGGRQLPGVDVLTCTSGSTGEPSVVLLEHACLDRVAESLRQATDLRADDRHLVLLPQAVLLETVGGLRRAHAARATLVVPALDTLGVSGSSGFDPAALDAAVRAERISSLILMPAQLADWVHELETTRQGAPSTLRFVGVGGAPGPASVLERALSLGMPVSEGYGLSEAGSVVSLDVERDGPAGSVGRALPHAELRLAEDGELHVRGAICLGRLDEVGVIGDDGWLATGDLARQDERGRLWILGRKGLRFATGFGRNLSPEWLERALLELPQVGQAVVFGDGLPGPVALLAPTRGDRPLPAPAQLDAALATLNATLPDYARIRGQLALDAPLNVESGLWAGTGRPRRAALWRRFRSTLRPLAQHPLTALPSSTRSKT